MRYRVFISVKCCNFSELCPIGTGGDRSAQSSVLSFKLCHRKQMPQPGQHKLTGSEPRKYFKIFKNTIFNEHPVSSWKNKMFFTHVKIYSVVFLFTYFVCYVCIKRDIYTFWIITTPKCYIVCIYIFVFLVVCMHVQVHAQVYAYVCILYHW